MAVGNFGLYVHPTLLPGKLNMTIDNTGHQVQPSAPRSAKHDCGQRWSLLSLALCYVAAFFLSFSDFNNSSCSSVGNATKTINYPII